MGNLSPDWSFGSRGIDLGGLEPEEKLLAARVGDLADAAAKGAPRFTAFLNERQQLIAQEVINGGKIQATALYGGYPDAVRRILGVFPSWLQPEAEAFPLSPVTIHLPKMTEISHRDVLGALMALRIDRACIGDILISGRRCDVFVQQAVAPLILDELKKIGSGGVRCETGLPGPYRRTEHFEPMRGTVSSPRMDALVALLTGLSREKGTALLGAGQVQCNYRVVTAASTEFSPGDVISIRGYGKYKVDTIGNPTKKGRLPVLCSKYT